MTLTLTLHWYYLPIALALIGVILLYVGGARRGPFAGMVESTLGLALMLAAAASMMVGVMK